MARRQSRFSMTISPSEQCLQIPPYLDCRGTKHADTLLPKKIFARKAALANQWLSERAAQLSANYSVAQGSADDAREIPPATSSAGSLQPVGKPVTDLQTGWKGQCFRWSGETDDE